LSSLQTTLLSASLNLLITHRDYDPAYVENASRIINVKLGTQKAAQRVLTFASAAPRRRRYPHWVSFTLTLLPLSAGLLAYWCQRNRDQQRKAFLDQWESHLDLEPVRVHTRSEEDDLFQSAEVASLARDLRKRRPEPTSQLAVDPTVRNTAARAGLFTPVRRQRKEGHEYLVLLESKGGRDQQVSFWNCLLDRLSAREVWLDRYTFSGDPRICQDRKSDRDWLRLDEISTLHPRHDLWVFSTTEPFFDPTTRQPAPWVPALVRWPNRAVLSFAAGSAEDREQLGSLGFAVVPASTADLAKLNEDRPTHAPAPVVSRPYPRILEEDGSRWLHGPAPAGESDLRELRSLDRQLRAWLGRDGYRCLLACCVYPGLAWNLTLHFARALIPDVERESTLARLVRLPWFRHGRMPQWLRAFFTDKLDADDYSTVKDLLHRFLELKAANAADSSQSLEFNQRDIAADLRVQGKLPTRDYVFLSFLLDRKPRLQNVDAPSWLRRLLYPHGLPILRLRRELWLVGGLIIAGLLYWGAESHAEVHDAAEWQERTAPATVAAPPVNDLSARALEIAAARLGQPAAEDFASLTFDQAVPFAMPRGMERVGTVRPGAIFKPNAGSTSSLVEQVTNSGLIMIELFKGQLRRVFRSTNEMAGSFIVIDEAALAGVWPNGSNIKVGFINGSAAQRQKVEQVAKEWLRYANLSYTFSDTPTGDARILFSNNNIASWSFRGTEAHDVPPTCPTMTLVQIAIDATISEDDRRTILHEFGHLLGMLDEIQNPNANIPWRPEIRANPVAYVYTSQVEKCPAPLNRPVTYQESLPHYRPFDPTSIMMALIGNEYLTGKVSYGGARELSTSDKAFVAQLYPK
jgi:hypothetical protein